MNPNLPEPTARGGKLRAYKKSLKLTENQKEILIGLMIGDISCQTQDQGKTCRFKFEIGDVNKQYADALYNEFKEWFLSPMKYQERINKAGNKVITWTNQTLSHSDFIAIRQLFYKNSKVKCISPYLIEKNLTNKGLAYWFMDDGSKADHTKNQGKGIHLHTQGFTEKEVESLCVGLRYKFNFKCWVGKNKNKPIIVISGESYENLKAQVEPFLVPSMMRKLPSPRKKKIKLMT
jgi:hypothetical protein